MFSHDRYYFRLIELFVALGNIVVDSLNRSGVAVVGRAPSRSLGADVRHALIFTRISPRRRRCEPGPPLELAIGP